MSRWEESIEAVQKVRDECLGKQNSDAGDTDLDQFTKQKKMISKKIKKIRETIKKRDEFLNRKMLEESIKFSNTARIMIADVFGDAEQLRNIHEREEKKFRKKAMEDEGYRQLLANRTDIVRLAFTHIQECEMLEAQREKETEKEGKKRVQLFRLKERPKEQENGDYGIVKLPDIDKIPDISVESGFEQQDKNDQKIELMLDQVLGGVVDLKELAKAMGDKIQTSNLMIEDITDNVEDANKDLKDLNLQLKRTLKKLRSPKKLCFDIFLILLFLGMIGLIVKVVISRV